MKVNLISFQDKAVKELRKEFAAALYTYRMRNKTQVISLQAPTGAGKTIIAAALIESGVSHAPVLHTLTHDPSCTLSLLYMGIICTGVGYSLWNKSLSILDAGVCSSFYPVQPAVSTLLGILLLGETLTVHFLLGSALIVCGVLLGLSSSFRRSSPDVS